MAPLSDETPSADPTIAERRRVGVARMGLAVSLLDTAAALAGRAVEDLTTISALPSDDMRDGFMLSDELTAFSRRMAQRYEELHNAGGPLADAISTRAYLDKIKGGSTITTACADGQHEFCKLRLYGRDLPCACACHTAAPAADERADFPKSADGAYLPCPICRRQMCDHTPSERAACPKTPG